MIKFHRRTRISYWSSSAFAKWIRRTFVPGAPHLSCGTATEWRNWRDNSVRLNPTVHWFTEEFLNKLQNFVLFPLDVMHSIRVYISNRFETKTHMIDAKLSKGDWHETDQRMLHGMFELFVDFIETEKAGHALWSSEERTYKKHWWERFRSRELGMQHLEWEASLIQDDEWVKKDDPRYGLPTPQALSAKEQIELYLWWKDIRPNRPDPYVVSGYHEQWESHMKSGGDIMDFLDRERTPAETRSFEISEEMEKQYDEEDEQMLIRLIKIRQHLWT